ncbi:hypothetical protein P691DRAFT_693593 [Macrolepiota fuliginosa MF-IS2]|uniref:Uncharacterized protein n=1 Tax=Macrolepiota fuliginosa MF-IS2 TaxID=1400762 RepID=A0A9P5XM13_9AGAR|nr:hypothetical protein P691DRAFT_693593 [Macrolepiota fuliginosa MF-IS2]
MSFSLSDTLYAVRDPQDESITQPLVDSKTGVRTHNSHWLAASQKAHVVILNKGPRPAPAWTFDGGSGNWSFARDILQELNGPRERSLSANVITAALHAVYQVYLPELIRSMNALQQDTRSSKLFLGSWYQQATCTNAGLSSVLRTTRLIWESDVKKNQRQIDPWTLYYNTQIYIIDRVLPTILPYFNVTFIPMTIPLVPDNHGLEGLERMDRRKDCLRPNTSHPVGEAIQMALMKSLLYLFQNQ